MEDKIALIILAAGESKRLGRPKQLLAFEGNTLLQDMIKNMGHFQEVDKYVVLGHESNKIIDQVDFGKFTVVFNRKWKNGLGSSIAMGIKSLERSYDYVLFLIK